MSFPQRGASDFPPPIDRTWCCHFVAQTSSELTALPRLASDSWQSPCLSLLSDRMPDMTHHAWLSSFSKTPNLETIHSAPKDCLIASCKLLGPQYFIQFLSFPLKAMNFKKARVRGGPGACFVCLWQVKTNSAMVLWTNMNFSEVQIKDWWG